MIEIGDILEYTEIYRTMPLGQPEDVDIVTYWVVIEINESGSCRLFSLNDSSIIQEFTEFLNDPNVYKKL